MELTRSPLVVTRANGVIEHGIFIKDGTKPAETLVHLEVLPSGHATMVDYDTHPSHHPDMPPAHYAERVKRFLEFGGAKLLGHPNDTVARDAEVARVKAKHGLV